MARQCSTERNSRSVTMLWCVYLRARIDVCVSVRASVSVCVSVLEVKPRSTGDFLRSGGVVWVLWWTEGRDLLNYWKYNESPRGDTHRIHCNTTPVQNPLNSSRSVFLSPSLSLSLSPSHPLSLFPSFSLFACSVFIKPFFHNKAVIFLNRELKGIRLLLACSHTETFSLKHH